MNVFIISYDLRAPGRNYQSLYDALKKVPFAHALGSVWLIEIDSTAVAVRDALRTHMDANDGLVVFELPLNADWAVCGLDPAVVTWLQNKRP